MVFKTDLATLRLLGPPKLISVGGCVSVFLKWFFDIVCAAAGLVFLSPSSHKSGDVFIPSGLSAEGAISRV